MSERATVTQQFRAGRARSALVILVLAVTGTVVSLQQTLVVPLLPEIPHLLNTTPDNASWVVTSTLLAAAVATPILSRAADMYGKRRVVLLCLAIQVLGSLIGAVSDTLLLVILARVLQGTSVALIPVGISIMRDELPRERIGAAVALMSATIGIGAAVGLPLAGLIYEYGDWHMLFWVSGGFGALMFAAVWLVLEESAVRTPGRFDFIGALMLSLGLVALLLPVTKGNDWGWTDRNTLALLVAAAVIMAAWIPYELRSPNAMVDLRTMARRPVALTNAASLLVGFSMYGNMLSSTQALQLPKESGYGFGMTVLVAGLWMLPASLVMVALAPVSASITRRWGGRVTLIAGALIMSGGYVARVFFDGSVAAIIITAAVVTAGTAIAFAAMPVLIMSAVPITETASANGVNTLVRALGTSSSSAAVVALLTATSVDFNGVSVPTRDGFAEVSWVMAGAGLLGALAASFLPRGRDGEQARATGVAGRVGAGGAESSDLVLTGQVVASGETPVRNAVVTVLDLDGHQMDWGRVDPAGTYTVVLPGPGRYLRLTAADGWEPRSEVVTIDNQTTGDVNLGDHLAVRGTVVRDGERVPGALVTMTRLSGELVSSTHADMDGTFELPLSSHGRYVLVATDTGTGESTATSVTLIGHATSVRFDIGRDIALVRREGSTATTPQPTADAAR